MHYYVLVLLPNTYADSTRDEIEEAIRRVLTPSLEGLSGGERENVQCYIDSFEFVIGGRWSGVLGKDIIPVSELPRPLPDDGVPAKLEIDTGDIPLRFLGHEIVDCTRDEWHKEVEDLLAGFKDCIAVVVDLHE